jgi:hypothetical protein
MARVKMIKAYLDNCIAAGKVPPTGAFGVLLTHFPLIKTDTGAHQIKVAAVDN